MTMLFGASGPTGPQGPKGDPGDISEAVANGRYLRTDSAVTGTATTRAQARANFDLGNNAPMFHAIRNAGTAQTANGVVQFNDVATNIGSHYNAANSRFTAPIAGRYWFGFSLLCNTPASGDNFWITITRNGVGPSQVWRVSGAGAAGASRNVAGASLFSLSVGDFIEVLVSQYSGTGSVNNSFFSSFSGTFLG
jgi:C1q domain